MQVRLYLKCASPFNIFAAVHGGSVLDASRIQTHQLAMNPAEDLCGRQYLSVTVPHGHSRSFAAAQAAQEGVSCFLQVGHFSTRASVCQMLLRSRTTNSLNIASLLFIHPTTRPSNLFIFFLLFTGGERETDGFHTVDLHKRQVKLILCACVPVEKLEESQRVSVPHQDEVPSAVRQVSRGREAQRTLGTRAGHASERHTPEPALHSHPLTF